MWPPPVREVYQKDFVPNGFPTRIGLVQTSTEFSAS